MLPLVKISGTAPSQHLLQPHWHLPFPRTSSGVSSSKAFFPRMRHTSTEHHSQPLPDNIHQEATSLMFPSKLDVYRRSKNPALKATTTHIPIRRARPPRERNVSAWIKVHFIAGSCCILLQRLETRHGIKYFTKHTFCPQSTKMLLVFYRVPFCASNKK